MRACERARSVRAMSLPIESSSELDAKVASPTRVRVFLNRLIFRSMLFVSGGIAIALYRVSKPLTWRISGTKAE